MGQAADMRNLKTACPFCQGHIEYPNTWAGLSKPCPHCGKFLQLPNPNPPFWPKLIAILALFVVPIGGCFYWLSLPSGPSAAEPAKQDTPAVVVESVSTDNGIIIGYVKSQTSARLRKLSISYSLYDKNGAKVGNAIDYISELEPYGVWKFKANVWDRDAASYRLESVTCSYGKLL